MKERSLAKDPSSDGALTAFPSAEEVLRNLLSGEVCSTTFKRRISRCNLEQCRGNCCYDGIFIDAGTAESLRALVAENRDFFESLGLEMPKEVVVQGEWRGQYHGLKTALRQQGFSKMIEDYPPHFEDTACVFLVEDGRCSLQVLAERDGRHRWFYKPEGCWLHPIRVTKAEEGALVLHDEATEPYSYPDYPAFTTATFCGRSDPAGEPAFEVLAEEIELLSKITGHDYLVQIRRDLESEG